MTRARDTCSLAVSDRSGNLFFVSFHGSSIFLLVSFPQSVLFERFQFSLGCKTAGLGGPAGDLGAEDAAGNTWVRRWRR